MKIHGICVIKNESDVIEEALRAASAWCDHIYVFDNGSTDGTWEIVQRLAGELKQIQPWRQDGKPFSDGLRQEVFEAFRVQAQPGDWWARVDADEFYVTDPRAFLQCVSRKYGVVWYASLSYYFSSTAAEDYAQHPERYADSVPVAERCRYYSNHWSEPRFVRHELMTAKEWKAGVAAGWPPGVDTATACPVRILCKHYCYRSPSQIERRIETRKAAALSGKVFSHEAIKDWAKTVGASIADRKWQDAAYCTDEQLFEQGWRSRVIDTESLHYDAHDGQYVVNEQLMPELPGSSVPYTSIASDAKALINRVAVSLRRKLLLGANPGLKMG